jgi:hypothetical protein
VRGRLRYCIGNVRGSQLIKNITVRMKFDGITIGRKTLLMAL